MPKEKLISNFHEIMKEAYEDRSVLDRTYSIDKVAKLLGTSKTYAQKKISKLKKEKGAVPVKRGGETMYRFTVDGIAYLTLDEYQRELGRIDKRVKDGTYQLNKKGLEEMDNVRGAMAEMVDHFNRLRSL
jgi:biotin operon repressor